MTAFAVMQTVPEGAVALGVIMLDGQDMLRLSEAGVVRVRAMSVGYGVFRNQ